MAVSDEWITGYDCIFVRDPPQDLICLICTFVARDPEQLTCCGRVFCRTCLEKQRSNSPKCPHCSGLICNFPDSRSERHIKSLRVRCNSYRMGCVWEGELRSLHIHDRVCTLSRVDCPNKCSEVVLRKDLQYHIDSSCPRRRYKCPHCHQYGTYRAITSAHILECPEVIVPCPNGCSTPGITRSQLEAHNETCPMEEIACPYDDVGCRAWLLRKDMHQHKRHNQQQHLELATQTIATTKKMVNKLKTQQQLKPPVAVFKVPKFQKLRAQRKDWNSPPFYTHPNGYKMCLNIEPNGCESGTGTHVSVFVCLMKGENDGSLTWPCKSEVTIELLNQLHDDGHLRHMIDLENENATRVEEEEITGSGYGLHKFVCHEELGYNVMTNAQYLKDDCLYFRVRVESDAVYKPWLAEYH